MRTVRIKSKGKVRCVVIATRSILNGPIVKEGCPFCPSNGNVKVVATSSCGRYYLIKVISEVPNQHYFVIPVSHMEHFMELDDDMFGAVKELVVHIPWYDSSVPLNLSLNQYVMAGQRVLHIHWWIIYRGDESGGKLGPATLIVEYDKAHAEPTGDSS